MTLEESKEVIPMMEAMITQIEDCLLYTSHVCDSITICVLYERTIKFKFTELNQKSSKELFFLFYNSIIMVCLLYTS